MVQGRHTSVASQATASSATASGGKRSAKQPDPPVFYHEEDRDTEKFEQWYRAMENKLEVNADHFPTDRARQAYIESRLGGTAAREIAPYLQATHPEPLDTSARLLAHLWNEYRDPLAKDRARSDFNKLELRPGGDYLAFKNNFVRLAGESGKPRSEWKSEFHGKILIAALRTALAAAYVDPNTTFDQYTRLGAEISYANQQAREAAAERRQETPKTNKGNQKRNNPAGVGGSKAGAGRNNNGNKTANKLTPDEVRKLYEEGRCFNCKERGHKSHECPRSSGGGYDKKDREARIQAIQAKWANATATEKDAGSSKEVDAEAASDSEAEN